MPRNIEDRPGRTERDGVTMNNEDFRSLAGRPARRLRPAWQPASAFEAEDAAERDDAVVPKLALAAAIACLLGELVAPIRPL
jgi:hypothetical protein